MRLAEIGEATVPSKSVPGKQDYARNNFKTLTLRLSPFQKMANMNITQLLVPFALVALLLISINLHGTEAAPAPRTGEKACMDHCLGKFVACMKNERSPNKVLCFNSRYLCMEMCYPRRFNRSA